MLNVTSSLALVGAAAAAVAATSGGANLSQLLLASGSNKSTTPLNSAQLFGASQWPVSLSPAGGPQQRQQQQQQQLLLLQANRTSAFVRRAIEEQPLANSSLQLAADWATKASWRSDKEERDNGKKSTSASTNTSHKRRQTFNKRARHAIDEKSVSMLESHLRKDALATGASYDTNSAMISKSSLGYFVINNITLKSCRDVLKPVGLDRCTLSDYIEDCASDEGLIDYVAFFFCAFSPERMPLALLMSILWLLTLFVATGVTATDFLCPTLFMISRTLGLSQNIAGVTFLAFGNTSADIFAGSGTLITTAIVGCVFAIKDFRLDRLIFVRDTLFYLAAVSLLFYIFHGPGRIRLQDSAALLGLYILYVIVVLASKYFTKDGPLKNLHGPSKKNRDEGVIEFEGVYIDDDPTASMVVMRRFFFYDDDALPASLTARHSLAPPTLKVEKLEAANGDTITTTGNTESLTVATHKSSRRVTLFADNLFTGANSNNNNSLSPEAQNSPRRNRSASLLSISKAQMGNIRRASRDIRRQSMDFLAAVSPIDINVWKQRNWGGRTMELVKAPIRLFLLITTPTAYAEHGRSKWNKPLSTLHCITGPIFVVYSFGYGSQWVGPLTVSAWVFIISAPISLLIIFTSTSETPPFYYNAYSSYLGFVVAVTWIYTISSEVINLLRALGIAFNLSNEIMGLTILAWGNCMLDFITNVSIARKGLPKMAIAACYGGPLMSTLVGIGLPAFIALLLDPNHNTKLGASPLLYIIFLFLIFALVSGLLIITVLKFNIKRSVGIYLIVLYALLIIAEWLTEFRIIELPFLKH